jgi:voltage-gated potassium channel Kch
MVPTGSSELAKLMSASIAPVFLITGVGGILSTMVLRYGRVIDRIRTLLRDGPKLYRKEIGADHLNRELRSLYKRARLLRLSIILGVTSIFAVSITIAALFFSLTYGVEALYIPQFFFVLSLVLLMVGLALFIQDFAMSLACIEHDMDVRSSIDMSETRQEAIFKSLD